MKMMKGYVVSACVFGAVLLLNGCALRRMIKKAEQQKIVVSPAPLELHGGSVQYEVEATLPVKMLPSGKVYTLVSYYKPEGEDPVEIDKMEFVAEDYPNNKTGPVAQKMNMSFDYKSNHEQGTLWFKGIASNPANGKYKETELKQYAEGTITTPLLVESVYAVSYADHGYNDQEEIVKTEVDFFFEQGSSTLRTKEKRSERGQKLDAFIAEKNVTKVVTIFGEHSPEGTETINTELADKRAAVVEEWYKKQMKKYDYKEMGDQISFQRIPIVRDWSSFKEALENYNGVNESQKQEILSVVNGRGFFEDQQLALEKLTYYKKLLKEVYPGLRTAQTEVNSVLKKKTKAEIMTLTQQSVKGEVLSDSLSVQEMLYAAHHTPELKEKESIYQTSVNVEDTWVAHNNLAAVHLSWASATRDVAERKKYVDQAVNHLEIATKKQGETPEVLGNLAVAYLLQGNDERAYDNVVKALGMGPSASTSAQLNSVKGALDIKKGDYSSATKALAAGNESPQNTFNKGLVALLSGDEDTAQSHLEKNVKDDIKHAKTYYVLAIVSAKKGEAQGVVDHLKLATEIDSSSKERATKDLEFRNYKNEISTL